MLYIWIAFQIILVILSRQILITKYSNSKFLEDYLNKQLNKAIEDLSETKQK
jgi:hypothetical protein